MSGQRVSFAVSVVSVVSVGLGGQDVGAVFEGKRQILRPILC